MQAGKVEIAEPDSQVSDGEPTNRWLMTLVDGAVVIRVNNR